LAPTAAGAPGNSDYAAGMPSPTAIRWLAKRHHSLGRGVPARAAAAGDFPARFEPIAEHGCPHLFGYSFEPMVKIGFSYFLIGLLLAEVTDVA